MTRAFLLLASVASLGLAGCSSGQGLTTSSILGGGSAEAASASQAKPISPQDRAIQVAAVSARAQKCGYNFDPMKLRGNYLASEAAGGLDAGTANQLGDLYDKTNRAVLVAVQSDQGFCTEEKTRQIKADLTRHLAGDFSPARGAVKVEKADGGMFGWFTPDGTSREVVNPEWMRDPRAPKTIRVEQ